MTLPALRDELIHDFLQAVYGKGLHPEDAAIHVGIPIESFIALRKENPTVNAAWFLAEEKEAGKLTKPKTVLELKHSISQKIWRRLEPRVLGMIDRIELNPQTDDEAEKADEKIMELLKHKIISETLPRESYGQVDQQVTVKKDPYSGYSDEELLEIAEKRFGRLADLKESVDQAALIREKLATGEVIDVQYKISDSGETERDGRATEQDRGQQVLPVHVDAEAVASDEHPEEDDGDSRS